MRRTQITAGRIDGARLFSDDLFAAPHLEHVAQADATPLEDKATLKTFAERHTCAHPRQLRSMKRWKMRWPRRMICWRAAAAGKLRAPPETTTTMKKDAQRKTEKNTRKEEAARPKRLTG